MNNDIYLAGVDIGTTGAKAIIFNMKGDVVGKAYTEYGCTYPAHNWVEQNVHQIVDSTLLTIKQAVKESGVDNRKIASISLSAQRSCSIFLDENNRVIRPMISWQDNRAASEVEQIKQTVGSERYYAITGFPPSTTWVLPKILWVRENEPETFSKTVKVVQMHDYFLKALGVDDYYVDYNDAGFYGLFNSENREWDEELINAFDIDPNMLSIPLPSGTLIGKVSQTAAENCGLSMDTVIAVGAGDQSAGSFGSGIIEKGMVAVSLGTAGAVTAFAEKSIRDSNGKNMVTNCAVPEFWLMEGFQAAAASVYKWYKDRFGSNEAMEASSSGMDVFDILNKKAQGVPAGAEGLLLLPYFASAGTPRYNSEARGVLAGLTLAHDNRHVVRAFMEGITLDTYDMLVSLKNTGIEINDVRILGGPTKSNLWNQIQADIYGVKVSTLHVHDAAVIGAAILGGVGAGLFKTYKEGVNALVRTAAVYEPDPRNHEIYTELYSIFCDTYEALNGIKVFSRLSEIQTRSKNE